MTAMKIEQRWPVMIHDGLNLSVYLYSLFVCFCGKLCCFSGIV